MDISRKWLADYVKVDCDIETLCKTITMAGIEVEAVESAGSVPSGVVVGKILERNPHPDSDHMSVCKVDVGTETIQIVCGAPNCDAGNVVPVATIGTVFRTEDHIACFDGNLCLFIFLLLRQHDVGIDIVREILAQFLDLLLDRVFQMVTDFAIFACDVHSHSATSLLFDKTIFAAVTSIYNSRLADLVFAPTLALTRVSRRTYF
jgi:hypothetical protein